MLPAHVQFYLIFLVDSFAKIAGEIHQNPFYIKYIYKHFNFSTGEDHGFV